MPHSDSHPIDRPEPCDQSSNTDQLTTIKQESVSSWSPAKKQKTAMFELLGDVFITNVDHGTKTRKQQIEDEVHNFKQCPCLPLDHNPLEWWKSNSFRFPHMAQLAKCLLAILGTSVPSERVFSTAGDVVTSSRSCLRPENVNMLIFLKKNLQI